MGVELHQWQSSLWCSLCIRSKENCKCQSWSYGLIFV